MDGDPKYDSWLVLLDHEWEMIATRLEGLTRLISRMYDRQKAECHILEETNTRIVDPENSGED